jgi:8-amino-7-oxononanoate synthase
MKLTLKPYARTLAKLRQQSLFRALPTARHFKYDFSHNDYLGLSQHPNLINAAIHAADQLGVGSKASRLITSQQDQLKDLESAIAQGKQTERALVFATGFQANSSVLAALLDKSVHGVKPLVFSDKLNHASIHVGCQIAGIKQIRYQHADMDHLKFLLQKSTSVHPKWILTESVFGMDGDIAPMASLIQLAHDHNAMLYVDEAHATGLFGQQGYGFASIFPGEIDVVMGTFSKALGNMGAYVATNKILYRYLINRAKGLIYSTAPSPVQVAVMQAAWHMIPQFQKQVASLMTQAENLRLFCRGIGLDTGLSSTHIIPIILQDAQRVLDVKTQLGLRGIHVGAIRPPSVAAQQSRLRIALTLAHCEKDIDFLRSVLKDVLH